jgi:uncharacterized protein YijF (DUF1287 family)
LIVSRLLLAFALLSAAPAWAESDADRVAAAALAQVGVTLVYAPEYRRLEYPGGDLPLDRGVCTDVVIRALRAVGVDLQLEVHRDMQAHFATYPSDWGLRQADSNIDHRRVPNLEHFFRTHGKALPVSRDAARFRPGDLVSWRLDGGQAHIGVVAAQRSADGLRPLIVHNIGAGAQLEDVLFEWMMTGHFRYFAAPAEIAP